MSFYTRMKRGPTPYGRATPEDTLGGSGDVGLPSLRRVMRMGHYGRLT